MSSWKKRQIAWKQERKNRFSQHTDIVTDNSESESESELDLGSESKLHNVRLAINNNYRHVMDQPHPDTISVLRVRVYNQKFYFNGYPSCIDRSF